MRMMRHPRSAASWEVVLLTCGYWTQCVALKLTDAHGQEDKQPMGAPQTVQQVLTWLIKLTDFLPIILAGASFLGILCWNRKPKSDIAIMRSKKKEGLILLHGLLD